VQPGAPSRIKLRFLLAGIGAVVVAGTIATAFTAPLATRHPLLLIALDARNRYLILARNVDLVPFLVVGTIRRLLSDPLYWLLGRWYGDRAIRWLETKGGGGVLVTFTERLFAKAAYPMVFLFPGAIVCALAGKIGMPFVAFLIVNVLGTIASVSVLRLFGDILGGPVDAILGFFNRHLVATTIVTVSLVVLSLVLNRLQGSSEIPPLDELEAGPDADGDAGAGAGE
jgi:membrane protein DedA with SNARE-associated domain